VFEDDGYKARRYPTRRFVPPICFWGGGGRPKVSLTATPPFCKYSHALGVRNALHIIGYSPMRRVMQNRVCCAKKNNRSLRRGGSEHHEPAGKPPQCEEHASGSKSVVPAIPRSTSYTQRGVAGVLALRLPVLPSRRKDGDRAIEPVDRGASKRMSRHPVPVPFAGIWPRSGPSQKSSRSSARCASTPPGRTARGKLASVPARFCARGCPA